MVYAGLSSLAKGKVRYVLPGIVIIVAVLLVPIAAAVGLSFFSYPLLRPDLGIRFAGLDNFARLLEDANFYRSMGRSVVFTLGAVAGEMVVGTLLALLLRGEVWGRTFFRVAFMVPMMMVPVVVGVAWRIFLLPDFTPLEGIFNALHIPFDTTKLLTDANWAMVSVIVADLWQWSPFVMILVLANLQGIPGEIYEASKMDGAGWWRELRSITLPLLGPGLAAVAILRGMDAMRTFDLVYILTSGGPGSATELVSLYNYKIAFSRYDMGYASAISAAVMILLSVVIFGLLSWTNKGGSKR